MSTTIEKNEAFWYVVGGTPELRSLVQSIPRVAGVDTDAGWIRIHPGVHHSLVGMAAGALAAADRDALHEVLGQCGSPTPRAVCLYVENEAGKILAVSRKNDRTRFGLPGGKVDPGETDTQAVVREVREETGLTLIDPSPVFEKLCWGSTCYLSVTFTGTVIGEIHTGEPVDVRWAEPSVLLDGPFGDYNRRLFRKLGRHS